MAAVSFSPVLSTVAETIQTAIAPVFLLAGIGSFLNVLAGRLSRVVDRARSIEERHRAGEPRREGDAGELKRLDRRMSVINAALLLSVTSAVAVCAVVALLFVAELGDFRSGREVAAVFIFAMAMLTAGFIAFMIEVRLSVSANRVRRDRIARGE